VIFILRIQLIILILLALGFGITKAGMLSQKTRADLTNMTLYVFLPCSIFNSFEKGMTPEMLLLGLTILLAASGLQLLAFILNKVLYIKIPPERQVILKYTTMINNAGFMGLPVLGAVYGPIGVFYGSLFLIPARIMMWTAGISMFTTVDKGTSVRKMLTHPCMLAVFAGFAYSFAPFELPAFMSDAVKWIGETARILPMIVVGSILTEVKLRNAVDKHCLYFSFIRLIAMPAIMFVALFLLKIEPLIVGVTVLMAGMPSATVSAMFAEKYGRDKEFASKTVFVSTLLSIVTLPLLAAALDRLLPV